jgi:hypothetical protein
MRCIISPLHDKRVLRLGSAVVYPSLAANGSQRSVAHSRAAMSAGASALVVNGETFYTRISANDLISAEPRGLFICTDRHFGCVSQYRRLRRRCLHDSTYL